MRSAKHLASSWRFYVVFLLFNDCALKFIECASLTGFSKKYNQPLAPPAALFLNCSVQRKSIAAMLPSHMFLFDRLRTYPQIVMVHLEMANFVGAGPPLREPTLFRDKF